MHKHILSIDVGIRNFSYAFFVDDVLVDFGVDDLLQGVEKKEHKNYVLYRKKIINYLKKKCWGGLLLLSECVILKRSACTCL